MEVRPGYKHTEVGVIPESWDVKPLNDLGHFKNGINKAKDEFGHGFPFVNLMDVFGIPKLAATTSDLGLLESSAAERKLYELKRGDVLFVRSSVKPAGVGLTTLIPEDLPDTVFSGFLIRFRDDGFLDHRFKEHCFWGDGFRAKLLASSTVSANTNINQDALKRLQIAIPSSPAEQHAIGTALSDMDALLAGLDRLIAKKRELKQAAMQQLLNGQTRLPGFQGDWETKLLPDLAEIRSGGTPSTNDHAAWDGDIAWCTPTDITALAGGKYLTGTARRITTHGLRQSSAEVIPAGSVVMTSRATIGECAINKVPMTTNQGFKNFVPFESVDAEFLYYLLTTQRAGFMSLCAGSTFLEIGKAQLRGYGVRVPANKSEQAAIAAILSDMDAELTALEARRDKTRALKQAMMQELLTGRTRLV